MPRELKEEMRRPEGEVTNVTIKLPETHIKAGRPKNTKDLRGGKYKMSMRELAQIFRNDGINVFADMLEKGKFKNKLDNIFNFEFDNDGELVKAVDTQTGKDLTDGDGKTMDADVGFMCGGHVKDKMEGGEVSPEADKEESPAAEALEETTEKEPAAETPGDKGADMEGPFNAYKDQGVSEELVKKGNELFTGLSSAVEGQDEGAIREYTKNLKGFISELEAERKNSMGDSVVATAYKEMASEAKDLLSAFDTIMAENSMRPADRMKKMESMARA